MKEYVDWNLFEKTFWNFPTYIMTFGILIAYWCYAKGWKEMIEDSNGG